MMDRLPTALSALADCDQFVLRNKKIPIDYRTGLAGDPYDSSCWLSAEKAIETAKIYGEEYSISFVLTDNDPFFFLDIDNCLELSGEWSDLSKQLVSRFPGAAVEVSQSGKGLHVIGKGETPEHGCRNTALNLEFYTEKRHISLTGTRAVGDAGSEHTGALVGLVDDYFPPKATTGDTSGKWTTESAQGWNGPTDDDELIKRALGSKSAASAFGDKASFRDLWEANVDVLVDNYPPQTDEQGYDGSSADAALAQHLAFWTGNNCERILTLMWRSALIRDKWNRKKYMTDTILNAISMQSTFYTSNRIDKLPVIKEGPEKVAGFQYMSADLQLEHFKGCTYVENLHRVFTPRGSLLKSEQFNARYGGYVFQLDDTGDKTTKRAWEAFTESQVIRYPMADSVCFRPLIQSGTLIKEEGKELINTYVPVEIRRVEGDVTPFLNHLAKLLPVESDRDILIAYMAACVQHKGVKFQWCPLIQGTEGNGKTLFTRCVAYAVGNCYTHLPAASDLDNKFNGWLMNKLFIGVEDIYVPDHRREVVEALKPMITNDRIEIQSKGNDQIVADNFANLMANANHKDSIRKTRNDRRFCVFYTAQQTVDDVVTDGMDGDYFPKLYKWLKADGYAIVANYLNEYKIPDALNPAVGCHRAPKTSTTDEAVNASLGSVEQEIMEAIDEGRPGFAGGWISSKAVERLLQSMGMVRTIARNKRCELLRNLGYDHHPGLKEGRVNNRIAMDEGKPRLFIKSGHINANLTNASEIAKQYQLAQQAALGNANIQSTRLHQ